MKSFNKKELNRVSRILSIPENEINSKFTLDGDFNMLSGLISYFREEQNGHGFCAVSNNYAREVPMLLDNFRVGKVSVKSLPNPELKSNRPPSLNMVKNIEELRSIKKKKKKELQDALGLQLNPKAIIAAFVGRLVIQKGIDAIADSASELLLRYQNLQLIVIGPIGDEFGQYASARLANLAQNKIFCGRIFVHPKFFRFTSDYRLGCDFLLMPSRTEPFGFVDIEFAWCGCPVVGSLVGGLGKVPGWYFKLWQGGEFQHLKSQLIWAVDKVMEQGAEKILEIGAESICTSFPVLNWQKKLLSLYKDVLENSAELSNSESKKTLFPTLANYLPVVAMNEVDLLWSKLDDAKIFLSNDDKKKNLTFKDKKSNNEYLNSRDGTNSQQNNKWDIDEDNGIIDDFHKKNVYHEGIIESICIDKCEENHKIVENMEEGGHNNETFDEHFYDKLEEKVIEKILMGKKTNVKTVFKSTIWNPSWNRSLTQTIDENEKRCEGNERVNGKCQQQFLHLQSRKKSFVSKRWYRWRQTLQYLLQKEIAKRSVEAWIIAVLSIVMPSHSTLLYAKSIIWTNSFGWNDDKIGGIYAAHFAAFAVGCLMWIHLLRRFSIGTCLSFSSIAHVINLLYFTEVFGSNYHAAVLIAAVTGFVSSASGPVYTAAMFFDEWDGSLASKMKNVGFIEGSRTVYSGIFQGITIWNFLSSSSKEKQSLSKFSYSSLFTPYLILANLTVFGSFLLLLGMKETTRTIVMPKIRISTIYSFKAFPLLSLSTILDGFISYPTSFIVCWLLMDGFTAEEVGKWEIISSIVVGFALFIFSRLFIKFQGAPKCISVLATYFVHPVLLQALIMIAAPDMSAEVLLALLTISSFLIKLKGGLVAVLKLHVMNSRWKVVTFSCYELFFTNMASAISPFMMRGIANSMNLSLNAVGPGTSPEASAVATFFTIVPFVLTSWILQLVANKYAFLDISDIYTKIDWAKKKDN